MTAPPAATSAVHTVTDRELRSAAEAAAGSSDPLYLIRDEQGLHYNKTPTGGEVLLCVKRESTTSPAPTLDRVFYRKAESDKPIELSPTYDALFWSRAAYEKFVMSYYHSLRILTEGGMNILRAAYNQPNTIAIAHDLKSTPTKVGLDEEVMGSLHIIRTSGGAQPVSTLLRTGRS